MASQEIWVLVEHYKGKLVKVGLEIIGKALGIAQGTDHKVVAVVMGEELETLCDEVMQYGVDKVVCLEHPLLAGYCNNIYAKALTQAVEKCGPNILLMGATGLGGDPSVAVGSETANRPFGPLH